MTMIKTNNFELAAYAKGDPNASRVAILLPGRLDTKDYPHMRSHVDFFATMGFCALSFDPPGTWESPGDISLYTMTNWLQAIDEVIEKLDNRPTVLMGHSRGGTMAMIAGSSNESVTHIIAVMSHPGPSEPDEEIKKKGYYESFRDVPLVEDAEEKRFELPVGYFEDAAQYDAMPYLQESKKPKLFFLGTDDVIVDPMEIKSMFERSAEPKELHELRCGHDYRRHPEMIQEVEDVVERFLQA